MILIQAAGLWLAGAAAIEIATDSGRGAHLFGGFRWLAFGIAVLAGVICASGLFRDLRLRQVLAPGWTLRAAFLALVAGVVIQAAISARYEPVLFDLVYAVLFAGVSLLRAVGLRRPGLLQVAWLRRADLVLFQVALVLLLAEVGLRVVARVWSTPLLAQDQQSVDDAIARYRYQPGGLRYGFRFNSDGQYDEELLSAPPQIVSIGDSFSVGVVPQRYHFTTVAERAMPGWTIHNLGYAGTGPGAYLRLVETIGASLEPELILIDVFVGNDLSDSARWAPTGSGLGSWFDRRNLLCFLVPQRLLTLRDERQRRGAAPVQTMMRPGEELITEPTDEVARLEAAFPWLADPMLESDSMARERFQALEVERARRIHDADRHGWYASFFAAMQAIREAVGDIPLAVMLIPDEFQVEDALWQQVVAELAPRPLDRAEPQRRITAWLDQQGIPYLDLLPILRAEPPLEDGRLHLYHRSDTHFNARGNRLAGEALARFLKQQTE